MAGTLVSGPAGGGKSQLIAALRGAAGTTVVLADFQALYVAITGDVRGPDGKYPLRDESLLPLVEYLRRVLIRQATERGFDVLATNSDGNPERRRELLEALGPGSTERIVDPGREVVRARLADPVTEDLSPECSSAIGRWYDRL